MSILDSTPSRYWTTSAGIRLHYRDTGGPGAWCLLVHGLADGEYIWDAVAESLACSYRVLAIDLRGHGRSAWSEDGAYDLSLFAQDVLDLLQALDVKDPIIIGHSLGGEIALHLVGVTRFGARAVVLVDSGPRHDAGDYRLIQSKMLEGCRPYGTPADYLAWLEMSRPLAPPAALGRLADLSLTRADAQYRLRLDPKVINILEVEDDDGWWWDALRRMTCAVLIVRGSASGVLSSVTAYRMLSMLRDGRLRVVSAAGHGVMTDNLPEFLLAVNGFLRTLETSERARARPNLDISSAG